MGAVAYIDSSALIKLLTNEPETSLLEADLANRDGLVSSRLASIECGRAMMRTSNKRLLQALAHVLDAVYLVDITTAILDRAATLAPAPMRSLDAIHLATALSLDEPDLEIITYDSRMADAARANGLPVSQPGR